MSMLLAFLLAAEPATAAMPPENEIVVLAHKLQAWRGKLGAGRDGAMSCKTTKSTGDRAVDAIGCQALQTCLGPLQHELAAIAGADAPKDERRRRLDALAQAQLPCMERSHDEGLRALLARRAGN